jgi:hypothetical protein
MKGTIYFLILFIGCSGPQGPRTNSFKQYSMTARQRQPELSSFLDPSNGGNTTKITLPKNFSGKLSFRGKYLGLIDNSIKVRFKFGKNYQLIDIDASITKSNSTNPDEEVLTLDLSKGQFKNIPLLYDLFDYQDYRNFNGDEVFVDNTGPLYTLEDSFNQNLFCRGLNLKDDPTFEITESNYECDEIGEKCLYAYAKVADKSLFNKLTSSSIVPKYPQMSLKSDNYTKQTFAENLHKGLPDNDDPDNLKGVLNATEMGNISDKLGYGENITFENGETLEYQGPFQAIGYDVSSNNNSWEIKDNALIYPGDDNNQALGLFQKSYILSDPNSGYISMMFPRAGKLTLKANTEYFGSEKPFEVRNLQKMQANGASLFMDGANLRMKNYNQFSNEGISSCNVTASIEVISFDQKTGKEISLLKNPNSELKLQLIRPTQNPMGAIKEPLNLKSCSKSTNCANTQCCYEGICQEINLVPSCQEPNKKPANEEKICKAKEECKREKIQSCHIVKAGTSITGVQECVQRCYLVPAYGECNEGRCLPPKIPPVPYFDPKNPDCSKAIDPPLVLPDGTLRVTTPPLVLPDGTLWEPSV